MATVWNFLRRHRRKFAVASIVLGGGLLALKFASRKLRDWERKELSNYYEFLKKDQHFESTSKTLNETVVSLCPKLKSSLCNVIDADASIDALRTKPHNKLEIWDELKILAFCRPIVTVYACSTLTLFLNVQMNILGGYLYVESARKETTDVVLSQTMQRHFATVIQKFFDEGLHQLTDTLVLNVTAIVRDLSLKDRLGLTDVEETFGKIRRKIEEDQHDPTKNLKKFLRVNEMVDESGEDVERQQLLKMMDETGDILESEDCRRVFRSNVDVGFALLNDSVTGCYLENTGEAFVNPQEVKLPLAKLIPFLCNLIHVQCSLQSDALLQNLLQAESAKTFAANIYEAFSSLQQSGSNWM